jgi:four helix bundle protein
VAEAWRKRRYPAAFVSKLNDAEGDAAETQSHLEVCLRCGYLDPTSANRLDDAYEEVLSMLVKMASHPDKWTIRAKRKETD